MIFFKFGKSKEEIALYERQKKAKENIQDLISRCDRLETQVQEAQYHIANHIDMFPAKELECMAMDGLIHYDTIPEGKRTEWVVREIKWAKERGQE